MDQERVIIIGGGHAGLEVAKKLRGDEHFQVKIIDRMNHHLFTPFLFKVAAGVLSPTDIARPLRDIFQDDQNIDIILGEVAKINKEEKWLKLSSGEQYFFDTLVIATGQVPGLKGHEAWKQYAVTLKDLQDAIRIREKIQLSFEQANRCTNPSEAKKFLTFVIVGAGKSGVELSSSIASLTINKFGQLYSKVDRSLIQIHLVEKSKTILPHWESKPRHIVEDELQKLGIKLWTGRKMAQIDSEGILIEDQYIETANVFWTAHTQTAPFISTLGAQVDETGRVKVEPDLTLTGHPSIFIVGDTAHTFDKKKRPVRSNVKMAIQMGQYAGQMIKNEIRHPHRRPFVGKEFIPMSAIGKQKAVLKMSGIYFSGALGRLLWNLFHICYLNRYKNIISALFTWAWKTNNTRNALKLIYRPSNYANGKNSEI